MKNFGSLVKKYPKIFELMKDPYYRISSDVPDTWVQTLDWMCGAIQGHIDNINIHNTHLEPISQVQCQQVKEKYGGLRFYYIGGDKLIEGMVYMAEHMIWNTCIECGIHENIVTTKGWTERMCKDCANKNNIKYEED